MKNNFTTPEITETNGGVTVTLFTYMSNIYKE